MKKKRLIFIALAILAFLAIVAAKWSDYSELTSGYIADGDDFLIRDVSDQSLGSTGTQKRLSWATMKSDIASAGFAQDADIGVSIQAYNANTLKDTKCINIPPEDSITNWLFYRTDFAITITAIDCIVDAATSVVLTPRECDGDGGSCSDIEAAITCATTNTTESGGIDNASIDAGDYIRITRGTVTGSPTQAMICITWSKN